MTEEEISNLIKNYTISLCGDEPFVSSTIPVSNPHKNFLGSWEISLMKFYSRVIRTLSLRFITNDLRKNLQYSVKPQVFNSFLTFSA